MGGNLQAIEGVTLSGPFVLAPLAGVTDAVMRSLSEEFGAAMTCTEMVSAKGLYYGDRKTPKLLYIPEHAGPTAIQIFGSDPEIMGKAAEMLKDRPNVTLDINMGCPVPKVVKSGDGSALMKNPDLAYDVIRAVVDHAGKPVTVKTRKAFDDRTGSAVEIAKAAEAAGAAAVAVHGRTREQYYHGKADWSVIREVKQAVSIPVIGNGDVLTAEDGIRMMDETGCDLVMVARGAMGNPWLFRDLDRAWKGLEPLPRPSRKEVSEIMLRHFEGLLALKGEYTAVREMRKHVGWYTKGLRGASELRGLMNQVTTEERMREVLRIEE